MGVTNTSSVRRRARWTVALVLACLLVAAGGLTTRAASPAPARSTLSVSADRLVYLDRASAARFTVAGACVTGTSVRFERRVCEPDDQYSRGVVSSAELGFSVVRDAEILPADTPVTRSSHQAADDHLEIARIDLHAPGELTVRMVGHEQSSLRPQAVKGTATPRGRFTRSSVEWRVAAAEPGEYEFSAVFRPRAPKPALGYFLPELHVELVRHTNDALPSPVADASTAGAKVTSTLRLRQHEAAAYGPPKMGDDGVFGGSPGAWVTPVFYETSGNYHSATGRVSHAFVMDLRRQGYNTAGMGYGSSHWLGMAKVNPIAGFRYRVDRGSLDFRGFKIGLRTEEPGGDTKLLVPTDPLGGTIFDGDSQSIAVGATAGRVTTREKRAPAGSNGTLITSWDGRYSEAWGLFAEHRLPDAPTEPSASLHREASVPLFAAGGDIDNREGSTPVKGKPLLVRTPPGEFGFIGIGVAAPEESKLDPSIRFTESGALAIVPRIMPGGYMLESTGTGLDRDWAANLSLSVTVFDPKVRRARNEKAFLFPPRSTGTIWLATSAGSIERFDVGPGLWRAVATKEGVTRVERLAAPVTKQTAAL